jgi:hypothetical protein
LVSAFVAKAHEMDRFYVGAQAGYSGSMKAKFCAPAFWDASPEGYNAHLGNSAFYQSSLGYQHCSWLAFQVSANYRPGYEYCKFQTSTAVDTNLFLGTKTRFLKLSSLAFMADIFVNKLGEHYSWESCGGCLTVAPFIGAGVGVAYNNLYDFHSVVPAKAASIGLSSGYPANAIGSRVYSMMNPYVNQSFAAQGAVGLVACAWEKLNVEVGYRFFYGGKIQTNNYGYQFKSEAVVNQQQVTVNGTGAVVVNANSEFVAIAQESPPWYGKLMANEFFVGIFGTF